MSDVSMNPPMREQPARPAWSDPPEDWAKYCWVWFANHHHWYYSSWTEQEWVVHFNKYVQKKQGGAEQGNAPEAEGPPVDEVEELISAMFGVDIGAETGGNHSPAEDEEVGGIGVEVNQMEVWNHDGEVMEDI